METIRINKALLILPKIYVLCRHRTCIPGKSGKLTLKSLRFVCMLRGNLGNDVNTGPIRNFTLKF